MRKLYFFTSFILFVFSISSGSLLAANFYAQSGVSARLWTNIDGTVWYDAPTGGNAYGAGVFPGSGDDVYTNGVSVVVNAQSTCRNLFVESATVNGIVLFLPLTIEGTMIGWTENFAGFGFAAPSPPSVNTMVSPFGASITFSGTSINTSFFTLTNNEVIAYWNLLSPIPFCNFSFGAGVTGRIAFIGTFDLMIFTLVPEDIAFANNVVVGSGVLETVNVNMTGVRIGAGTLTVGTGATLNLDVPLTETGATNSAINALVISGDLNATDAGVYINADVFTLNDGANFNTRFSGADQTQGWWHTTKTPVSLSLNTNSIINFNATADQNLPAIIYGSLTLSGTGAKTVQGAGTFDVEGTFQTGPLVTFASNGTANYIDFSGNIINEGSWGAFSNNIRFSGSSPQTVMGDGDIDIQADQVLINNTVTISNNLSFSGSGLQEIDGTGMLNVNNLTANNDFENETDIELSGILTLGNGVNFDADGSDEAGSMVLLSTSSNTARVDEIPVGSAIGGTVTVQRYLSAPGVGSIFRYVSSPVTNGTAGQWTGTIGVNGNPWWYDETVAGASHLGWKQTSGALTVGRGFAVQANSASPIILALTGELNQGIISVPLTYNNGVGDDDIGWNLVANPYASTIDLDFVSFGGDQNAVLSDNTTGGLQYHYYNKAMGTGTGPLSGGLIASGQSFWALATAGGQSVGFTEASKTTNNGAFRRDSELVQEIMTVNLIKDNVIDVALIGVKDGASPEYDELFDTQKRTNAIFNIASYTQDDVRTAINVFGQLENGRVIPLDLYNIDPGTYSITITETLDPSLTFVLLDHFLNDETPIEPSEDGKFTYNFEVTSDQLTFGAERFSIQIGESVITGIEEDLDNVVLYPNPVSAGEVLNLNVSGLFENVTSIDISIIDQKGALLSEQSMSPGINGSVEIDMDAYRSGVYILRVIGNNATHHYKVIKN